MNPAVSDLAKQAESLSAVEQIELAMQLLQQAHAKVSLNEGTLRWADVRGLYAYPMTGEDAQAWVNQLRDDWDDLSISVSPTHCSVRRH